MNSRTDIEDMTDAQDEAPERIWIDGDDNPYFYVEGELSEAGAPVTEYVRADLAHPSQAGDERVTQAMASVRELLEIVEHVSDGRAYRAVKARARAALAAMDTPKGGGDE